MGLKETNYLNKTTNYCPPLPPPSGGSLRAGEKRLLSGSQLAAGLDPLPGGGGKSRLSALRKALTDAPGAFDEFD